MKPVRGRGAARAVADLMDGTVLASVEIAASPERVFSALASEEIVKWWVMPGVFETLEWTGEVRPGGSWRAAGLRANGQTWSLEGEFIDVDPPSKLVHTWRMPGIGDAPSLVTYSIERVENGARITLRHTGIGQRDSCMGACMGWESSLTQLAVRLGELNG